MTIVRTIWELISNQFTTFYVKTFLDFDVKSSVKFKKIPFYLKHKTAKILIGKNTTINSSNYGYHINMFSKCKLYADKAYSVITIGENCRIHGTCIHAYNKISIGDNCLIAANTNIIDANGHELNMINPQSRIKSADEGMPIVIGDNVWIAANCIILGGTTIGNGSVITAASVVKGFVPANCLFGGNPAKLIKQY